MSAAFQLNQLLYKPERLAGFIKSCRAFGRYAAAVSGNNQKFLFTRLILTSVCHLKGEFCIALRILNNCLTTQNYCIEEMGFLRIILISYFTAIKLLLRFRNDSLITDFQHLFIFNGHMTYAIVKIISRRKNIVVDSCNRFRSHVCSRKLTGSFALPVFMYLS